MTIKVTDDNFDEIVQQSKPVVVDFYAEWCPPCKAIAPILEKISGERDDIIIAKLDTDHNPITASKFGIISIPTMIVFKNGEPVTQWSGALPEPALKGAIDQAIA